MKGAGAGSLQTCTLWVSHEGQEAAGGQDCERCRSRVEALQGSHSGCTHACRMMEEGARREESRAQRVGGWGWEWVHASRQAGKQAKEGAGQSKSGMRRDKDSRAGVGCSFTTRLQGLHHVQAAWAHGRHGEEPAGSGWLGVQGGHVVAGVVRRMVATAAVGVGVGVREHWAAWAVQAACAACAEWAARAVNGLCLLAAHSVPVCWGRRRRSLPLLEHMVKRWKVGLRLRSRRQQMGGRVGAGRMPLGR